MTDITIALDAMGGDFGPKVVVPAALKALKFHPQLKLILVGDEGILRATLTECHAKEHARLMIQHATETVAMDELPSYALRYKKDSSMRVAINLVRDKFAQACVSAGNTGALMVTARFVLKTLPGIDRPAIISELPAKGQTTRVLDLGANVDSCAEHLFQFAVMGSVLASKVDNIANPRVGLLNIGVEEIKGNDQVKRTAQLLAQCEAINYIGYVEGDDIFKATADVIVCDGFVGNVALKSAEGIAKLIVSYLKTAFRKNWYSKLAALISYPVLRALKKQLDPARYNGASLLGLNGIVVKSHGGANVIAFMSAIEEAMIQVQKDVPKHIGEQVARLLQDGAIS